MSNFDKNENSEKVIDNVVTRWEELGFLQGVDEKEKKYLADLYEALADSLMNNRDIKFDEISKNILFNILGAKKDNSDEKYGNDEIVDFLSIGLFPCIRRVYEVNKCFSYQSFVNALNTVTIDNEFINSVLNDSTVDAEAEYVAYISAKIIEKLND